MGLNNWMLEGEKVIMIPYLKEHVDKYHDWMKDPELLEATGSDPLSLLEEYQMQHSWNQDPNKQTFIILDKQQIIVNSHYAHVQAMAGDVNVYMSDEDDDSRVAEIEIMIAESKSRGKGLGKESVLMMMSFALQNFAITIFRVKIAHSNLPSLNMFRKMGFHQVSCSHVFKEVTLELPVTKPEFEKLLEPVGDTVRHKFPLQPV